MRRFSLIDGDSYQLLDGIKRVTMELEGGTCCPPHLPAAEDTPEKKDGLPIAATHWLSLSERAWFNSREWAVRLLKVEAGINGLLPICVGPLYSVSRLTRLRYAPGDGYRDNSRY
jgi:hypothetical protein